MFELKSLHIYQLNIPYHFAFKPALDRKAVSQIFWIQADTTNGCHGFGEFRINSSTNTQSTEEARQFIEKHQAEWTENIHTLDGLITWITNNKQSIDSAPEIFSAVEYALLDAMSQYHDTTIEKLLGTYEETSKINNIAVLNQSKLEKFMLQYSLYEQNVPDGYKLALDGQYATDSLKSSFLLNNGTKVISFNANHLWDTPESLIRYINALPVNPYYIENPLSDNNQDAVIELSQHIKSRIIIDHKCLITHDSETCLKQKDSFILNFRVPKLGGLIRTLNIIQHARKTGLKIIIGENADESSLSVKASQIAASAAKKQLLFQETIYSIYMFNEELYKHSIINGINSDIAAESMSNYISRIN